MAILLVLGRHQNDITWWHTIGWCGVDLFFVLSGYLVSGLLMDEHKRLGKCQSIRFLIRRGFKIYPGYYFFILFSIGIALATDFPRRWEGLPAEVFFLQNYLPGFMFMHLWTLAVEEHFYFALAFFLPPLLSGASTSYRIPKIIYWVLLGVLLIRSITVLWIEQDWKLLVHGTHARIDALAFGVLICWFTRFRQEYFYKTVEKYWWVILGLCLINFLGVLHVNVLDLKMKTVGYSFVYLGFGGLLALALCLKQRPFFNKQINLLNWVAAIGKNSYATYLWHPLIGIFVLPGILSVNPLLKQYYLPTILYLGISLSAGWIFTKALESPFLNLREKIAP